MRYIKIVLTISVWLVVTVIQLQAQNCYILQQNASGIDQYDNLIEDKACELQNTIETPDGGAPFMTFGYDFYRPFIYINENEGYDHSFACAAANVEKENEYYLLITKEYYEDGNVTYRVVLKLPPTDAYSQYSNIDIEAMEVTIKRAIEEEAAADLYHPELAYKAENKGIETLIGLLNGSIHSADALELNGFTKIPYSDVFEVNISPLNELAINGDFCDGSTITIKEGDGDSFSDFKNLLPTSIKVFEGEHEDYSAHYMISSHLNTTEHINDLENYYKNGWSTNFVAWFHFEEDEMYVKVAVEQSIAEFVTDKEFEEEAAIWGVTGITVSSSGVTNSNKETNNKNDDDLQWGRKMLDTYVTGISGNASTKFGLAIACGLLDGMLASLKSTYDLGQGIISGIREGAKKAVSYWYEVIVLGFKEGALAAATKVGNDAIEAAKGAIKLAVDSWEQMKELWDKRKELPEILDGVKNALLEWIGEFIAGDLNAGYDVGKLSFDVLFNIAITAVTGGAAAAATGAKFLSKFIDLFKTFDKFAITRGLKDMFTKAAKAAGELASKVNRCRILGGGCFVKDTPVLMANTSKSNIRNINFGNTAKAMAVAASMPIVAVPIQEVQLLDYAVAHETVNEQNNLIASTDEDLYLGLLDKDPYTSDQQRERDKHDINDTDWYSVSFEQVDGTSKCHFALHDHWIKRQGYETEKEVILNLPEHGINGPFRVTAIKHIIPQKKPSEDAGDGYDWKPVTGLFEHQSNQVYNISFDSGEVLGVTYQHPIFSVTEGDWKLAGELQIGEQVLTKDGEAVVTRSSKKEGSETVYNLEVQELHNFLVGESGIVVHNACWKTVDKVKGMTKGDRDNFIKDLWDNGISWDPSNTKHPIFGRGRFSESLMRKGKYKDHKYTGKGFDGDNSALGVDNYPSIDFYKGNVATSMKTTRNSNPWSWRNQTSSSSGQAYNKKHLDDLINGMDQPGGKGKFGSHADLQNVDKVELDVFVKEIDSAYPQSAWQDMVDDYLTTTGNESLIGKIKVNLGKLEDHVD